MILNFRETPLKEISTNYIDLKGLLVGFVAYVVLRSYNIRGLKLRKLLTY